MPSYRLTRNDFQARFDALGRLTHLGHPRRIREKPSAFHLQGPIREGNWTVNCGRRDIAFDPETTERHFDLDAATLTLRSRFRGVGEWFGLDLTRAYSLEAGLLRCDFTLTNWMPKSADGVVTSAAPIRRLRYCTGINCWTDFSSDWAHRPFPTNLRCEQEFFWAAAVSPAHDVVGIFTSTKCDNWRVVYEGSGEQRVRSIEIDFINSLDLHPNRWQHQEITLGRDVPSYSGTFYLGLFSDERAFFQKAADILNVPFAIPERCSGFSGEALKLDIIAPTENAVAVSAYAGNQEASVDSSRRSLTLPLGPDTGWRKLNLTSGGMSTEACIWQHEGWSKSLRAAAHYATDAKPPSGYNAESILALITVAQAAGLLNDEKCRNRARDYIEEAYSSHYDRETGLHRTQHHRLQNYGSFLDAIRVYHRCLGNIEYIDDAQRCARQLMSLQGSDGNFYRHHSIYNNVIHPVKSLFDWGTHLREHGREAEAAEVLESVERAYRNVAAAGDDTGTEGADHFEDGMTSCAGYQIAALWPHFGRRREDLEMAVGIYQRRRALKCRVPDSRYFGSTLRHWEGYWAVGLGECMLGGHGWNAWSASLAHALFMATGEWHYIVDAYATLANCMQAIDLETGTFAFGFAIDPYWHDYFGLGSQHRGEEYCLVPDEITVASESHSAFLTMDDTFFRQVYVRLTPDGVEVLNGRVLESTPTELKIESYALDLREIVVAHDNPGSAIPRVTIPNSSASIVTVPL